jgi:hypothetical protein
MDENGPRKGVNRSVSLHAADTIGKPDGATTRVRPRQLRSLGEIAEPPLLASPAHQAVDDVQQFKPSPDGKIISSAPANNINFWKGSPYEIIPWRLAEARAA